jgi:hypothetical protein
VAALDAVRHRRLGRSPLLPRDPPDLVLFQASSIETVGTLMSAADEAHPANTAVIAAKMKVWIFMGNLFVWGTARHRNVLAGIWHWSSFNSTIVISRTPPT